MINVWMFHIHFWMLLLIRIVISTAGTLTDRLLYKSINDHIPKIMDTIINSPSIKHEIYILEYYQLK